MIPLLFLLLPLLIGASKQHHHRAPIIDVRGADELVGSIREDERVVSLVPDLALIAESGPVCHYELTWETPSKDAIPFEITVIDGNVGTALIKLKDGITRLDCSKSEYRLNMAAIRCGEDSVKSESAPIKIQVKDTNDHAPEFDRPWYSYEIDEGKITDIAQLTATDKDCGHPYGQICRYEITNVLENNPFTISDQGILRTTQALNYSQSHSHILSIVAHDCGMRKSKSALVTVNVREACIAGIHSLPERTQYYPATGPQLIASKAKFSTCPEKQCTIKNVEAMVKLRTDHISLGCDHEAPLTRDTKERCGLSLGGIDLLPHPDTTSDSPDDQNYAFDGTDNAVIVPENTVKTVIPNKFTLSFSMRHAKGSKEDQAAKHTVLCESDDINMNRHHMAVLIRHCKLEMVMRREHETELEAAFRPAEWRWMLPETCDDRWHHYAIVFANADQVDLYVDGKKFETTEKNPEILDDWPLHGTKSNKTKLVVGACWHGKKKEMAQFFKGRLASMLYLPNAVEVSSALQCMHQCQEQLRFDAVDQLVPGESAVFDTAMSSLTLKANSAQGLSSLLQKVAYENERETPSPGHRIVEISGSAQCNEGNKLQMPVAKTYIFVEKTIEPVLSISGQALVSTDQHQVKLGAAMLPDVKITITQMRDGKEVDVTSAHMLDWCKVHMKPSRDLDLEYFSSPASLIASLHVDFEHDKQGVQLKGVEKVKGYREILAKIHYFNTRPDSYQKRIYTVQCSMLGGRVLSNEFLVTMDIKVPEHHETSTKPAPVKTPAPETVERLGDDDEQQLEMSFDHVGGSRLQNILEMDLPRPKALLGHHAYDAGQGAIAGGVVAIVVVICVAFLLVLLVVGVLKLRDTPMPKRRRNRKGTQEGMEWDDAGMNITVNPLEDVEKSGGGPPAAPEYSDEDEEMSEGGESYRDEEDLTEDDEETEPVLPHVQMSNGRQKRNGLEWDDSTLANTRTYRV